ncbi:PREDICTED: origin recognition complex subunit 5-like [Amphimedon queenslandica]|uniref:Orc1-like AAA ATPase domain-containing protein n=1 Tax=Amphimedon queenslandica TaxID=400682 RepID=A0AAN0JAJ0_AMPQE|nr:PREDICTED: origin recognition complex subunit 5-like [Amphimedon queenslandica]|eukprot:XP_019853733.1 PREDICTED: origin recognition complex subunit 5-like [Amphimedon queenslandica]
MEEEGVKLEEERYLAGEDREEVYNPANALCKVFPGRRNQINTLLTLMRKPSNYVVPFIFIHGLPSTGKSSLIKSLLSLLKVKHCFISVKECYCRHVLFESILHQLTGVTQSGYSRCDSLSSFVRQLKLILTRSVGDLDREANDTVYIVIDDSEELRKMDDTIIPALIRIQELTLSNVCVIFISCLEWKSFVFKTKTLLTIKTPFKLHFAQYSKDDVISILSNACACNLTTTKYSMPFLKRYASIMWDFISPISRDLKDLLYISNIFFPLYCKPVEQGHVSESASWKLCSHIEPHFKAHISNLILRDQSSEIYINQMWTHKQVSCHTSIEFPVSLKYLLIASYLGSYNPLISDRRFFSKVHVHVCTLTSEHHLLYVHVH